MSKYIHHFVKLSALQRGGAGILTENPKVIWERYFGSVKAAKKYVTVWSEVNRQPVPDWSTKDHKHYKGRALGSDIYYTITKLHLTKLHPALQKLLDDY